MMQTEKMICDDSNKMIEFISKEQFQEGVQNNNNDAQIKYYSVEEQQEDI
jgi:hypothetical protein